MPRIPSSHTGKAVTTSAGSARRNRAKVVTAGVQELFGAETGFVK